MTGQRTRSERLLHETVGASVLPRHLGHRHFHTHIFAYAHTCVNQWWLAERSQLGHESESPDGKAAPQTLPAHRVSPCTRLVKIPAMGRPHVGHAQWTGSNWLQVSAISPCTTQVRVASCKPGI